MAHFLHEPKYTAKEVEARSKAAVSLSAFVYHRIIITLFTFCTPLLQVGVVNIILSSYISLVSA